MSREIKFRAWDSELEGWMLPFSLVVTLDGKVLEKPRHSAVDDSDDQSERYKLMQYTGLKDRNGREIYEGDIVRQYVEEQWTTNEDGEGSYRHGVEAVVMIGEVMISTRKGVVMRKAEVVKSSYESWVGSMLSYKNVTRARCEVIGNIYENPEKVSKGGK